MDTGLPGMSGIEATEDTSHFYEHAGGCAEHSRGEEVARDSHVAGAAAYVEKREEEKAPGRSSGDVAGDTKRRSMIA